MKNLPRRVFESQTFHLVASPRRDDTNPAISNLTKHTPEDACFPAKIFTNYKRDRQGSYVVNLSPNHKDSPGKFRQKPSQSHVTRHSPELITDTWNGLWLGTNKILMATETPMGKECFTKMSRHKYHDFSFDRQQYAVSLTPPYFWRYFWRVKRDGTKSIRFGI